jgi:hypothetical protein
MDEVFSEIALKIIDRQRSIVGPVALEQAMQVSNMAVDWNNRKVSFFGNKANAIDELVRKYEQLFGQISVEVCRDAAGRLVSQLPPEEQPKTLK